MEREKRRVGRRYGLEQREASIARIHGECVDTQGCARMRASRWHPRCRIGADIAESCLCGGRLAGLATWCGEKHARCKRAHGRRTQKRKELATGERCRQWIRIAD